MKKRKFPFPIAAAYLRQINILCPLKNWTLEEIC